MWEGLSPWERRLRRRAEHFFAEAYTPTEVPSPGSARGDATEAPTLSPRTEAPTLSPRTEVPTVEPGPFSSLPVFQYPV